MRQRRPLALVALWLIFSTLAALFPALPQLPDLPPSDPTGLRLFGLHAEPALIVFKRDGGLTATDRSFVATVATDLTAQVVSAPDQATHVLALEAQPSVVPNLRNKLGSAPIGLTSYVTGAAALLYDSTISWQNTRWLSLLLAPLLIGFITLFSRFGPRRVLVVIITTFSAGAVSSALAALVATPPAVAATAVLSASLAGAWAVRVLVPRRVINRPTRGGPIVAETTTARTDSIPSAPIRVTPLQRALIGAGEVTVLQTLLIAAGLIGLVFDVRSGLALFIGLIVTAAVSLSETPALIALLTKPRRLQIVEGLRPGKWPRLAIAVIMCGGLLLVAPVMRPGDATSAQSESGTGYRAIQPNDSLPIQLLIQTRGDQTATLNPLLDQLKARSAIAAIRTGTAQTPTAAPASTLDLSALSAQATALSDKLTTQSATLTQLAKSLPSGSQTIVVTPTTVSSTRDLSGTAAALLSISQRLSDASADFARVPSEFPELAPRMSDIPALRNLPVTLDALVTELTQLADRLKSGPTENPVTPITIDQPNTLGEVRTQLDQLATALKSLTADAQQLQAAVNNIKANPQPSAVAPDSAYSLAGTLTRIELVPRNDPYDAAALNEAVAVQTLAHEALPTATIEVAGASVNANARRIAAMQANLVPGIFIAIGLLLFVGWGLLGEFKTALLAAIGGALSAAVGVAVAGVLFNQIDVNTIAIAAVALIVITGARLASDQPSTLEEIVLALPPLTLLLTGLPALMALGVMLTAGLLAGHFLIEPALGSQG